MVILSKVRFNKDLESTARLLLRNERIPQGYSSLQRSDNVKGKILAGYRTSGQCFFMLDIRQIIFVTKILVTVQLRTVRMSVYPSKRGYVCPSFFTSICNMNELLLTLSDTNLYCTLFQWQYWSSLGSIQTEYCHFPHGKLLHLKTRNISPKGSILII